LEAKGLIVILEQRIEDKNLEAKRERKQDA
jgi:hypothetical protein